MKLWSLLGGFTISLWTTILLSNTVNAQGKIPVNWTVLAQTVSDPDLMGQVQKAWNNFVQTGQIWALLIGLVIGYLIRNLTSYG
ncbi:hypothetical protein Riv7116_0810 [Rivularia sp. PCC 7116]|uniref:hypothetical protein n=1 Tax=Rivularia sp. PCC 7116 TaxID=373994 RepID=UPI00029F26E0|nr:hypothetical protein [Rivularia sp. PCC 7116]AFY53395.1 hypothetical protein Riv7116_0810 [Rivularia sp. PCC 7116]